jgi:pimeloyl-ACP methyl ester carboxylesterase
MISKRPHAQLLCTGHRENRVVAIDSFPSVSQQIIGMKTPPFLAIVVLASLAILATAFVIFQRPKGGRMPFTIWRAISSEAHGGRYANINDVRIYYETYGAGPPILVLHGGSGTLENMSYQIRALAPARFVIAPDSRGHGRSTDSSAPLSYALMASDMLALLDQLQIGRTDIVGWSDGAIIALDIAAHHPERVGKIVVIGANYDAAGLIIPTVPGGAIPPAPSFYTRHAPDPAHWPVLYRKLTTMWATQPHYSLEELGRITAPALIIAGEFDIAKREHTDQLARAIPRSEELIIPAATHNVIWEKTDVVNEKLLQFLNGPVPP